MRDERDRFGLCAWLDGDDVLDGRREPDIGPPRFSRPDLDVGEAGGPKRLDEIVASAGVGGGTEGPAADVARERVDVPSRRLG